MRALLLLILLANLILVAAIQTGWEWQADRKLQPQPVLNDEKIRLIQETEPVPTSSPADIPPAVSNRTRSNFQLALSISSPVVTQTLESICLEWGEFSPADVSKVTKSLAEMNLGNKVATREVDQVTRYWVYIPPLPNKAAINRKISQLKARGIEKYFVVQKPGDLHNAISLGVFKSSDAAQKFLEDLQATRDIRTAKVGEHADKQQAAIFLLNNVDESIVTRVTAMQQEFPDAELKKLPCAR